MGLVLRIEQRRLGAAVRPIFEAAEAGRATVHVPAMVFAEIQYLSEKQKRDISLDNVAHYLTQYPGKRICYTPYRFLGDFLKRTSHIGMCVGAVLFLASSQRGEARSALRPRSGARQVGGGYWRDRHPGESFLEIALSQEVNHYAHL
jgi:hypothetical protein